MYNYVKENGYDGAAIKCESNTGAEYSVGFYGVQTVYRI